MELIVDGEYQPWNPKFSTFYRSDPHSIYNVQDADQLPVNSGTCSFLLLSTICTKCPNQSCVGTASQDRYVCILL